MANVRADAFSAAFILVMGHINPLVTAGFSGSAFDTAWSQCLFTLRFHGDQIPAAERAATFLESLKTKVSPGEGQNGDATHTETEGKS